MNNLIPSWTYRYDIEENRDDNNKLINCYIKFSTYNLISKNGFIYS